MIGKPEWFIRRRYSGWGLTPKTWQGWVYVLGFVGLAMLAQTLVGDVVGKVYVIGVLVALLLADVLHIMSQIKLDEREAKIEAIAERNASWTMISALAVELMYVTSMVHENLNDKIAPLLIFVMIAGMLAKSASYFYLRNREL